MVSPWPLVYLFDLVALLCFAVDIAYTRLYDPSLELLKIDLEIIPASQSRTLLL